ncbi:alpha-L-fucosidase [Pontiellaceae bacterium B12227]|nr:alpha-L-fucosidase [Pontiellaceae bacterium B12227]
MRTMLIQPMLCVALAATLGALPVHAAKNNKRSFNVRIPDTMKQTADSDARLDQWFRDAKYGAFIHFGAYSPLEGEYKGRGAQHAYSEWIELAAKIPAVEYRREVAAKFNPVDFDADAWVKVFKENGMRYVVITSKHHDGFALYDSAVSDYNIVDHTPFKRDVVKELSEACHKNGLKFGIYYSQAQDWDEPDAPFNNGRRYNARMLHPDLPKDFKPDTDSYLEAKSLPQIEELMKNYEIDLVWFDTPAEMTFERAKRFTDIVRKYRPDCLINSRIIHRGPAKIEAQNMELFDYISIADKEVPNKALSLYFESPDSVSHSYGYKTKGTNCKYHSEKEMMERMVLTVCSGGNYLLNNGPMGNGKLDPEAVRLYGILGKWLKVNGESIYGTRPSPLAKRPAWGDVTMSKDGKNLYLHILNWPEDRQIVLNEISPSVSAAQYLASGNKVEFRQSGYMLTIKLGAEAPDTLNTVVALSLK